MGGELADKEAEIGRCNKREAGLRADLERVKSELGAERDKMKEIFEREAGLRADVKAELGAERDKMKEIFERLEKEGSAGVGGPANSGGIVGSVVGLTARVDAHLSLS